MHPDRAVAHITLKFGFRGQSCNGVDHHKADRTRAHQCIGDFKRLFPCIGLRNQKIIQIHAQFFGILWVKRVFGIDKGANPALLLLLRDRVKRQRGLPRAFRAIDFDDPPLWQTPNPKGDIEPERACRCRLNFLDGVLAPKAHDRALAKLALDLCQGAVECLLLFRRVAIRHVQNIRHCHWFGDSLWA